jgi:electron transport complex protein RnfB
VVFAILPNINCGICGSPGCAAFAIKVANKEENADKCVPGKRQNVPEKVAKIMALSQSEIQKIIEDTSGEPAEIKKKFES